MHPRVPPHLSLPSTWTHSLSSPRNISDILLFRESKEEREARLGLGIGLASDKVVKRQPESAATMHADRADEIHPSTVDAVSLLHPLQGVMDNHSRPLTTLSLLEVETISEDPAISVSNAQEPWSPSMPQSLNAVTPFSTSAILAASSLSLDSDRSSPMKPSQDTAEASPGPSVGHSPTEGIPSKLSMDHIPSRAVLSNTSSTDRQAIEEHSYKYDMLLASGDGVDSDDGEVGSLPEINMGSDED